MGEVDGLQTTGCSQLPMLPDGSSTIYVASTISAEVAARRGGVGNFAGILNPCLTPPPRIPPLINILRVKKIPSGTTFASHRLIGHVFGPLFGYRWRVHATWVNVNRDNKNYGTTNDFPEFGGHFRQFFGARYDRCRKSGKDGLTLCVLGCGRRKLNTEPCWSRSGVRDQEGLQTDSRRSPCVLRKAHERSRE